MNTYQRALRDFQAAADDVQRSRYRTFSDTIRRVAACLVPGTPLGDAVDDLPSVEFDTWLEPQKQSVRGLGGGRLTWPDDARRRLALQVVMVRRLGSGELDVLHLARDFLSSSNHFDDYVGEFQTQIFRPFVRDFIRYLHDSPTFADGLQRGLDSNESTPEIGGPLVFLSHSSSDADAARALVVLLEKAMKISARDIRCTSVDGYRLPIGEDTNEALRTEVFGARILIALLTPTSLVSQFVLFELGARWGARRPLFPILSAGLEASDLQPPLSGLNALSASSADQMRQLLENTAEALSLTLEPMGSYSAELERLVVVATG